MWNKLFLLKICLKLLQRLIVVSLFSRSEILLPSNLQWTEMTFISFCITIQNSWYLAHELITALRRRNKARWTEIIEKKQKNKKNIERERMKKERKKKAWKSIRRLYSIFCIYFDFIKILYLQNKNENMFDNTRNFIYKPHSLQVDGCFQEIIITIPSDFLLSFCFSISNCPFKKSLSQDIW